MTVNSGDKAFFSSADAGTFHVQFNPKELKLEDSANYKFSKEQGQTKPLLTYEQGQPAVLSMDLIFDTTDSPGKSAREPIEALRAYLIASVPPKVPGVGATETPPEVDFNWKDFVFEGVVEKVSSSMLMFAADGTPLRSKVSITMKERSEPLAGSAAYGSGVTLASGSSIFTGSNGAKQITTQAVQTAAQAASYTNVSARTLAKANPGIDPTNIPAGTVLTVPADENMANILAGLALGESPSNTTPESDLDPFGLGGGGEFGGLGNILPGEHGDLSGMFSSSGLGGMVDQLADKAHELLDKAKDKVNDVADEVVDKVMDKGVALADKVGQGDRVEDLRDDAHEAVDGAIDDGAEEGHEAIEEGREKAHEFLDDNS